MSLHTTDASKPSGNNRSSSMIAFYAAGGLREIIPIYPLYAIMFGSHGVSAFELSLLFVIWALVGLMTEVPSGAWADTYSRKWIVVASGVFKSAGFLTWYLWQDFSGYALGFILWGFGSSLRSGAFEAILYDLLHQWDEAQAFTKHYGRISALATMSAMTGEILGGILIIYGYDFVLLVSVAIPLLASIPFIIYVRDAPKEESVAEINYLQHLLQGISEAIQNKRVLFILLASTFLVVAGGVVDEYVPPVMFEKDFSLSMIAFLAAPMFMAEAAGEYLAERFEDLSFDKLLLMMMLGSACLLPIFFGSGYLIPALFTLYFFLFGLASTVLAGNLQEKIDSASRATVTSIVGFGDSLGAMIWFLMIGVFSEFYSISTAISLFTVIIILACGIGLFYRRKLNI